MNRLIYLAGGFKGELRESATKLLNAARFEVFSPRDSGSAVCAPADLAALEAAGIVFAFIPDNGASALSLSAEIGFARALKTPVVYVDALDPRTEYFDFIRALCTSLVPSVECGVCEVLRIWSEADA
jgi:nucleoside 2-deoxyribosyltransferase